MNTVLREDEDVPLPSHDAELVQVAPLPEGECDSFTFLLPILCSPFFAKFIGRFRRGRRYW